jgi:hypothetical protein
MTQSRLEITPTVTVHELLEAYPQLEDVLIGIAAPFKKLKNPMLRKTVGKVATIRHISSVGNVPLDELIGKLREAVGQEASTDTYSDADYFGEQPDWYSPDRIAFTVNEATVENSNEMTLAPILRGAKNLGKGDIIELVTGFLPAPGIDLMKNKGYAVWTKKEADGVIKSYFLKNGG